METFKQWIKCKKYEDSPVGDLARDMYRDNKFPNSKTKSKCQDYLFMVGACNGAHEAFNEAFVEYMEYKHGEKNNV